MSRQPEHYRSSSNAAAGAGLIVIFVLALAVTIGFIAGFVVRAVLG